MSIPPFRRYTRRDRTSAGDQNAVRQRVEDATRDGTAAGGGLHQLSRGGARVTVSDAPETLWVQITAPEITAGRFEGFTEQVDDGAGNFVAPGDPFTGSPAFPAFVPPGWPIPAVGDVVPALPSADGASLLLLTPPGAGPGGTLAVQGSTGTPSYAGVGTLVADQGNGLLTLSQPSAGAAMLTVNPGPAGSDAGLALAAHSFTRPILPPPEDEANALIRGRVFNHTIPYIDLPCDYQTPGDISVAPGLPQVLGSGPKTIHGSGLGSVSPALNLTFDATPGAGAFPSAAFTLSHPGAPSVGDGQTSCSVGLSYSSGQAVTLYLTRTGATGLGNGTPVFDFRGIGFGATPQIWLGGVLWTPPITVGSGVGGGTPGGLLGVDSGGNLGNVGVDDGGLILSGLVFAP